MSKFNREQHDNRVAAITKNVQERTVKRERLRKWIARNANRIAVIDATPMDEFYKNQNNNQGANNE